MRIDNVTVEALARTRETLVAAAGGVPQSVLPQPRADGEADLASWDRQLVDPALVEIALELDVPLRIPAGAPETYAFSLQPWCERSGDPADALERVIAHPWFSRVLVNSFLPRRETSPGAGNWLDRAARTSSFAPVVTELETTVIERVRGWTLGALAAHGDWFESLLRPTILRQMPRLVDLVRSLDAARLLAAQLRAGSMDEWGWPALDEAAARLGGPPDFVSCGPPPYLVYHSRKAKRVIAFGPDGIVLDREWTPPFDNVRSLWCVGADVLACSYPERAQWIAAGTELTAPPYGFYQLAAGNGHALTKSGCLVASGAAEIPKETARGTEIYWYDGQRYTGITSSTVVAQDLGARDPDVQLFTLDPSTGERGPAALPAWLASLLGPDAQLHVSNHTPHLMPVPATAAQSPLGAKDNLGGIALVSRGASFEAVGIDGRRGPGLVSGQPVVALITFPERAGYYPVVMSGLDLGLATPDGTPLVPFKALGGPYWSVRGFSPPMVHWYALRPRDPEGSRALAACTEDSARTLVDGRDEDSVRHALPALTHPGLIAAVVGLAEHAHAQRAIVERIQGHLATALEAPESSFRTTDAAAFATLVDHGMHWWIEEAGQELGQQMIDVSRYLFGDGEHAATPARTIFPWDVLFTTIGEVLYRALASGTPAEHRAQLVGLVRAWAQTRFPDELARVRRAKLTVPSHDPLLRGTDPGHRDRLFTLDNRYFLRRHNADWDWEKPITVRIVEATRDGTFRLPERATLVEEPAVDRRFDRAAIESVLRLADERKRVELDPASVALVAKDTGLSPTAATLLWSAGYAPWLVGDKARERLRIQRGALDAAEKELKKRLGNSTLGPIYTRAMPAAPAQMFTLEGAAQLARAWNERTT